MATERQLLKGISAYIVEYKAGWATCHDPNIVLTQIVYATREKEVLRKLQQIHWGSDEPTEIISVHWCNTKNFSKKAIQQICENVLKVNPLKKQIKSKFLEDGQFIRFFNNLFSDIHDEIGGTELRIQDVFNLNNGKPILYERVPNSRLEFLMYLKSAIDVMINSELEEANENNISVN